MPSGRSPKKPLRASPAVPFNVPAQSILARMEEIRAEILAIVTKRNAERSAVKMPVRNRTGRPGSASRAVESVIDRVAEVIGDRDEAMRWLGTPVRALDYATPISLLGTKKGAARVEDVLGRMEHGVW